LVYYVYEHERVPRHLLSLPPAACRLPPNEQAVGPLLNTEASFSSSKQCRATAAARPPLPPGSAFGLPIKRRVRKEQERVRNGRSRGGRGTPGTCAMCVRYGKYKVIPAGGEPYFIVLCCAPPWCERLQRLPRHAARIAARGALRLPRPTPPQRLRRSPAFATQARWSTGGPPAPC
jgi:hypothetical protein